MEFCIFHGNSFQNGFPEFAHILQVEYAISSRVWKLRYAGNSLPDDRLDRIEPPNLSGLFSES